MVGPLRVHASDRVLDYYVQPAPMSDPGEFKSLLVDLPPTVPELVRDLQGLLVHVFWAERYGLKLDDDRKSEVQIRPVRRKLARLLELNDCPLSEARPFDRRLVGNCRDFSLLCSAMLRSKGIPARARCGFGTYFWPEHFEDHWVVEYWKDSDKRWVMLDAQIDDLQKEALGIQFDLLDLPPEAFVTGGAAWQLCRREQANPDAFGIFEWHGWDFVKGNLFRDLLALNKFEILPWDFWPGMEPAYAEANAEDLAHWDRIADLTARGSEAFDEVRALYEGNPLYQAPKEWAY